MEKAKNFYFDISSYYSMEHHMKVFSNVIKKEGVKGLFKRAKKHLYFKYKGVDFSPENIFDLEVKGENKENASTYHAVLEKPFLEILQKVKDYEKDITKGAFLDYGSGKGFSLYMAYKFGFKEVIGVEFAPKLYKISIDNLKKLNVKNFKVYLEDASYFIPPKNTSLIFFYNPFNEEIMQKVYENIINQTFENRVYIAYHYPICKDVFEKSKKIEFLEEITCSFSNEITRVYKLKN